MFRDTNPTPSHSTPRLRVPYSLILAGPSNSGKSHWLMKLLRHAGEIIDRPPQRLVWCFGQWQPLYERMKVEFPFIEFVKGIPYDLEEDSYFDTRVNNMIVLDDLMSEAKNDPRVGNLFCRGSHHRNLSVCLVTQNVFSQGRVSRDITLNCHYMVLFNNPIDRQQVATLGRRIYPRRADYFMNRYENAVSRPYGYLFVDLKGQTPEMSRLQTNILPEEGDTLEQSNHHVNINGDPITKYPVIQQEPLSTQPHSIEATAFVPSETRHECQKFIRRSEQDVPRYTEDPLLHQLCWCEDCGIVLCTETDLTRHKANDCSKREDVQEDVTDMARCDVCGALFANMFEMGKHVQQQHEDNDSDNDAVTVPWRKRKSDGEDNDEMSRPKKQKTEDISEFLNISLRPLLRKQFIEKINKKKEDYIAEGHTERVSKNMAVNYYLKDARKWNRQRFTDLLIRLLDLEGDSHFTAILQTVRQLQKKTKVDRDTAVREAVRLHKKRLDENAVTERKGSDLEDSDEETTDIEDVQSEDEENEEN